MPENQILNDFLIKPQSKNSALIMETQIADNNKLLKLAIKILILGTKREQQVISWPLSNVGLKSPEKLIPFMDKLSDLFLNSNTHPSIKRNLLRFFEVIEIEEKYQVKILDQCLSIISKATEPIAVIAFSITVASKIVKNYPELNNELSEIIKLIPDEIKTPAVQVRIKRFYKR